MIQSENLLTKHPTMGNTRIVNKFAWLPTIVTNLSDNKDYFIWFKKYKTRENYTPVNMVYVSDKYVFTFDWVVVKKYI